MSEEVTGLVEQDAVVKEIAPEALVNEAPQVKVLSPLEQCLITLQEGLVQIGYLGRDQSNLVIEAASKVREAIKAIQEDAKI